MKQNTNKIIAVDFDGTIVEHQFPRIGPTLPGARETLQYWYDKGISVIIWTCRNHADLKVWGKEATIRGVQDFLDMNGIPYDTINEMSTIQPFRLHSSKVYADMYIDDRNLGGFPGWEFVRKAVDEFYENGQNWDHITLKNNNTKWRQE